jgi:hypothetical protein
MIPWKEFDSANPPTHDIVYLVIEEDEPESMVCTAYKHRDPQIWITCHDHVVLPKVTHYAHINLPGEVITDEN